MATRSGKTKARPPLPVPLLNAAGQLIQGLIPAGQRPAEAPALAIARELGEHAHLQPTPVP